MKKLITLFIVILQNIFFVNVNFRLPYILKEKNLMKDLHKINHRCLLELFSFNKGLLNGTHQSFQNFILLLIKLFVVVFPAIKLEALPSSSTIQCYECFNEKMCDESSRCKGFVLKFKFFKNYLLINTLEHFVPFVCYLFYDFCSILY